MIAGCEFFDIEEFAVSASYPHLVEPVPAHLIPNVERLVRDVLCPARKRMNMAFIINSGYRTEKLNRALKGSPTSQHRLAQAADVTCADTERLFRELMRMAEAGEVRPGQVIYYPSRNFVHCATPGARYSTASFHVHEPAAGLKYEPVADEQELDGLLATL